MDTHYRISLRRKKNIKYSQSERLCSFQDTDIERNKTVVDKDNITNITLTIHVEIEDGKAYPEGVPRPPGNASVVILEGKQALAFLNQMQKDFSNNRTKI